MKTQLEEGQTRT